MTKKAVSVVADNLDDAIEAIKDVVKRAVLITGAQIKDACCNYSYEINTGPTSGDKINRKGGLTTGFDYPELEAVLLARSTMSLALYYQMIGRAMRIHPNKESAWIIDLGGNIKTFGKIETMKVEKDHRGLYSVINNGKHLTNVTLTR